MGAASYAQVLMELMRHESIETTLKFYVGRNAETTAAALYEAVFCNSLSNTSAGPSSANESVLTEHASRQAVTYSSEVSRGRIRLPMQG